MAGGGGTAGGHPIEPLSRVQPYPSLACALLILAASAALYGAVYGLLVILAWLFGASQP
jgi:hypothetical protein